MLKLDVFSSAGVKKESLNLPKEFTLKPNRKLLSQAIRVYEDNKHPRHARVKTRGEVKISTRKIYRQKGTGMARHGAKSAPIFVGGGIAHGPKGLKKRLKLNQKMKRKALATAINLKARANKLFLVSDLDKLKKTKQAQKLLDRISTNKKIKKVTFVLSDKEKTALKALRNIKGAEIKFFKNLNAHDIFFGGLVLVDKDALIKKRPKKRVSKKSKVSKKKDKGE